MSVDAYKLRNLLKVEVRARDVAALAAEMCGPLFSRTTGAQLQFSFLALWLTPHQSPRA
ncbi:MAG: hypothetical protein HQL49_11770 [Gammaproteobacteria bacterium]|nr:hypothetical protein [Gammaproteobacteria bacterium]